MKRFIQSKADVWMPQVEELLAHVPAFIAGGAARWLVMAPHASEPADIDLFLLNEKDFRPASIALTKLGYQQVLDTEAATSFEGEGLAVQLIKPVKTDTTLTYGLPRDVLSRFSFTTEMFAVTKDWAIVGESAEQDTANLELVLNNITDPVDVAMRAIKYAGKGYVMNPGEMLKLFLEWTARPLDYRREYRSKFREAMQV